MNINPRKLEVCRSCTMFRKATTYGINEDVVQCGVKAKWMTPTKFVDCGVPKKCLWSVEYMILGQKFDNET